MWTQPRHTSHENHTHRGAWALAAGHQTPGRVLWAVPQKPPEGLRSGALDPRSAQCPLPTGTRCTPGPRTRSSCSSNTSTSSRGCAWGELGEPHHDWTWREAGPPPPALCAGGRRGRVSLQAEPVGTTCFPPRPPACWGPACSRRGVTLLASQVSRGLPTPSHAPSPRGTESAVEAAHLLLSLRRGGHGWVEEVAGAPWYLLQDPHHSLGL